MLINCQFDTAKGAPNTKRPNFACKNWKEEKTNCVNIMHFKTNARYIELENF